MAASSAERVSNANGMAELTSMTQEVYAVAISNLKELSSDFRGDKFTQNKLQRRASGLNNNSLLQQNNLNTAELTARASSLRQAAKNNVQPQASFPQSSELTLYQNGYLAEESYSRFGAYVRVEQDTTTSGNNASSVEKDYKSEGTSITLGGDYLLYDHYLFGLALGLPLFDSGEENAESEIDGLVASGYFSYFHDNWYLDFTASYALVDTDIERKISLYSDSVITNVDDVDSDIWVFSLGSGYLIHDNNWNFALESSIQHTVSDTDRYAERPSKGNSNYLISKVDDINELESTVFIAGASFFYPFRTSLGVFQPYLRSYVHYDFDANSEKIISQLQADNSGTILPIIIKSDDQLYGRMHLGISGAFNNDWHAYAEASTLIGLDDLSAYTFTIGVSIALD
ncbi:autotransporter domain-containing protein [Photobacterium lipolyticum]|uniref:Autotransporter domain-containing protein n=2 Tax=Photobacterium lipolyticum TaxID=266810 RepID=A0A2T3MZW9_9GAMM|nr:autotransporter domain-containing protein [Photobacterium lipolyticum]